MQFTERFLNDYRTMEILEALFEIGYCTIDIVKQYFNYSNHSKACIRLNYLEELKYLKRIKMHRHRQSDPCLFHITEAGANFLRSKNADYTDRPMPSHPKPNSNSFYHDIAIYSWYFFLRKMLGPNFDWYQYNKRKLPVDNSGFFLPDAIFDISYKTFIVEEDVGASEAIGVIANKYDAYAKYYKNLDANTSAPVLMFSINFEKYTFDNLVKANRDVDILNMAVVSLAKNVKAKNMLKDYIATVAHYNEEQRIKEFDTFQNEYYTTKPPALSHLKEFRNAKLKFLEQFASDTGAIETTLSDIRAANNKLTQLKEQLKSTATKAVKDMRLASANQRIDKLFTKLVDRTDSGDSLYNQILKQGINVYIGQNETLKSMIEKVYVPRYPYIIKALRLIKRDIKKPFADRTDISIISDTNYKMYVKNMPCTFEGVVYAKRNEAIGSTVLIEDLSFNNVGALIRANYLFNNYTSGGTGMLFLAMIVDDENQARQLNEISSAVSKIFINRASLDNLSDDAVETYTGNLNCYYFNNGNKESFYFTPRK